MNIFCDEFKQFMDENSLSLNLIEFNERMFEEGFISYEDEHESPSAVCHCVRHDGYSTDKYLNFFKVNPPPEFIVGATILVRFGKIFANAEDEAKNNYKARIDKIIICSKTTIERLQSSILYFGGLAN